MGSIPDAMWLSGNRVAIGNIPTGENIPAGALRAVLRGICIYLVDSMGSDILGGVIPGWIGGCGMASLSKVLSNHLYNWKDCLDKSGVVGTILMDLSMAFDCLTHDLITVKLQT